MQSTQRGITIIATVLFADTCTSRQSMFESQLNGLLPAMSALLAVGRLQPSSSLVNHATSASMQLTRLVTPLLVGVVLLGHHAVEANLQVVNKRNFKDTPYYGSPVSLKGEDIFFTLYGRASQVNVIWNFKSAWQIQLDKCDAFGTAKIEIADSCKWGFLWEDSRDFALTTNDKSSPAHAWTFEGPEKPPIRKLRIQIAMGGPPIMGVCAVADEGTCVPLGLGIILRPPDNCMLALNPFSVNITNKSPECPINVTIINAQLLYDFYEPTIMPPTMIIPSYTSNNISVPLWTGRGPLPRGYVTPPSLPLWTGAGRAPPGYVKPPVRYVRTRKPARPQRAPKGGGKSQYDAVGGGVSGFVIIAVVSFGSVARLVCDI